MNEYFLDDQTGNIRMIGVNCLSIESDGSILVGGAFGLINGEQRNCFGRLSNTHPITERLMPTRTNVVWERYGPCAGVSSVWFETSSDGREWQSAGAGQKATYGWELVNVNLQPGTLVRGRGWVRGGVHNGSTWLVQSTAVVVDAIKQTFSLSAPVLRGVAGAEKQLIFNIQSQPQHTYQLLTRPDLAQGSWLPEGLPISATGGPLWFNLNLGSNAQRYYRVQRLP